MKVELAYGKTSPEINLPDDVSVTVLAEIVDRLLDQAGAVRDALHQPIGSPPLKALVKPSDKIGIVFNDITRPTPNHLIPPVLLGGLEHVPDEQIVLFNSTGTHRPSTEAELREMLGDDLVDMDRLTGRITPVSASPGHRSR